MFFQQSAIACGLVTSRECLERAHEWVVASRQTFLTSDNRHMQGELSGTRILKAWPFQICRGAACSDWPDYRRTEYWRWRIFGACHRQERLLHSAEYLCAVVTWWMRCCAEYAFFHLPVHIHWVIPLIARIKVGSRSFEHADGHSPTAPPSAILYPSSNEVGVAAMFSNWNRVHMEFLQC